MSLQIIALLGLQGSGKTTKAKQMVSDRSDSLIRVNKDDIRRMLWGDLVYSPQREEIVKSVWEAAIVSALKSGKNVVVDDAGNLNPKIQETLQKIAEANEAELVLDHSLLSVPIETCIKRDLQRQYSVGEDVIRSYADRYLKKPAKKERDPSKQDCIVVDVDGTLAILGDRNPLDYMAAGVDMVNPLIARLLTSFPIETDIVLLTGREESSLMVLKEWLDMNFVPYSTIVMRSVGDRSPADQFKRKALEEQILPRWNVLLAIDDDPRVIKVFESLEIPCWAVKN